MSDSESDSEFLDMPETPYEKKRKAKLAELMSKSRKTRNNKMDIFISGPNKMITMRRGRQLVRLFGEWHGYEQDCQSLVRINRIYTILEYLEKELDIGGVDLYIEAPVIHLQDPKTMAMFHKEVEIYKKGQHLIKNRKKFYKVKRASYLSVTRNALKWCINPFYRNKCKYNKSRIHSTDLRGFYKFAEITKGLRTIESQSKWEKFKKKYAKTADLLGNINNCEDYTRYIMDLIYLHIKSIDTRPTRRGKLKKTQPIIKQLNKADVSSDSLHAAIMAVCKNRDVVKWVQQYSSWMKSKNPIKITEKHSQLMMDTTQEQISILHDIYTFLRMIKPIDGKLQTNIIFYGGLAHTEALKILLEHVGFKNIPNDSQTLALRCINIKE